MIIVDFSQMVLSSVHTQSHELLESKHALSMIRHLVLNHLRSIKVMISKKIKKDQSIVLACDGPHYWRRQYFPHYKAKRKQARDQSHYDYKIVFEILDTLIKEFKEHLPYYVLRCYETEADDIIGTLVMKLHTFDKMCIVASDKDFKQLQKYSNVFQFDPLKKKWIVEKDPEGFLLEHIIRGDASDGIPNVLSSDDCFIESKRQTPITQKVLTNIKGCPISEYDSITHFKRNQTLIDLAMIPELIQTQIISEYEQYDMSHGRSKMYDYFIQNRLINLLPYLQDF